MASFKHEIVSFLKQVPKADIYLLLSKYMFKQTELYRILSSHKEVYKVNPVESITTGDRRYQALLLRIMTQQKEVHYALLFFMEQEEYLNVSFHDENALNGIIEDKDFIDNPDTLSERVKGYIFLSDFLLSMVD